MFLEIGLMNWQPRIVTMPIIRIQSLVIRSFQTILDSK